MAKPAYHHGDLRSALLDATLALLAERGPEGVSLREAARRVGVSNAAPAHHFADLRALLSEVAAIGFERLAAAMRAALAGAATPEARLDAIGRAYVEAALAAPALFRLMFQAGRTDRSLPRLAEAGRDAYGVLEATIAALPGRGPDRQADIDFAWSSVHGFAELCIEGRLCGEGDWRPALEALLLRNRRALGLQGGGTAPT